MSGKVMFVFATLVLLALLMGSANGTNGELVFRAGVVCPTGSIDRYVDTSFFLSGKAVVHFEKADMFALWLGLNYIPFSSQTQNVKFDRPGYATDAVLTSSEDAWGLLIGGQIGSSSRNAFFRPYADAGIGLYLFRSTNSYRAFNTTTVQPEDVEDNTDTRFRPGAEASVGAALYFKRSWGIGMDWSFDYILNLRHPGPNGEEKSSVRFYGISLMAIFQFDD